MRRCETNTEHGDDRYLLVEASELIGLKNKHASNIGGAWYGETSEEFSKHIVTGDETLVERSEQVLARIEDQMPLSRGWKNIDDVVGAIPNVPAMLAGHPQSMRRRERTMKNTAPLAIYMDLTSSAMISAAQVRERGIVLLALTRMLVEHRPVELWVGTSLGTKRVAATVAWRIDTAPLDLARAAYHISAPAMARGLGYSVVKGELDMLYGKWPFDSYDLHCRTAPERMQQVFPGQELLYIPPIYGLDKMVEQPVEWLKGVMSKYLLQGEAA